MICPLPCDLRESPVGPAEAAFEAFREPEGSAAAAAATASRWPRSLSRFLSAPSSDSARSNRVFKRTISWSRSAIPAWRVATCRRSLSASSASAAAFSSAHGPFRLLRGSILFNGRWRGHALLHCRRSCSCLLILLLRCRPGLLLCPTGGLLLGLLCPANSLPFGLLFLALDARGLLLGPTRGLLCLLFQSLLLLFRGPLGLEGGLLGLLLLFFALALLLLPITLLAFSGGLLRMAGLFHTFGLLFRGPLGLEGGL